RGWGGRPRGLWVGGAGRDAGPYWRPGSLRPDYASLSVPTMIVAGWADGYRNNSLRTVAALNEAGTPVRLLLGPWSHTSPARGLPGPHLDLTRMLAGWFDRWLRGDGEAGDGEAPDGEAADEPPIVYFARRFTAPEPDSPLIEGVWRAEPSWPSPRCAPQDRVLGGGRRSHVVPGGVGTAAWNSCAGALPWGQPTDQRFDDARSLRWEWPVSGGELELLGYPRLRLSVTADQPVAAISAKLCDVARDGTSAIISRGLLNLTHRHGSIAPVAFTPG